MMNPLVSIIIPTYNRVHILGKTLQSIVSQTYTNWECIVIDDGSSDGTEKLMKDYCEKDWRFQYYKRPESRPKGANACRNYGFEICNGTYVNWFDDDDLMHKDKLKLQVESLNNNDLNFSICQSLIFEKSIQNIIGLRSEKIYSNNIFEDFIRQKIMWMTPSALWKKRFLQNFDYLFDEDLQAAQEWEFHCRVLFDFPEYDVIEKALVFIRQHRESISYNNDSHKRRLNYFFARKKVYHFLKHRGIKNNYLRNYLISHYKYFLKNGNFIIAFEILKNQVMFNRYLMFSHRIKLLAAFFIYPLFNRGDLLFKGEPRQL